MPVRRWALPVRVLGTAGAALILLHVAAEPAGGQRPRGAQQPLPTFRTEVSYVEVDVTVTDARGNFMRDLTREHFDVLEDGAPQEVSAFQLVELPYEVRSPIEPLSSGPIEFDVRTNAAESAGRVFVIVLDDLHTHPLRSSGVKRAARQFIEQYVGSDDLVSVIHTSGRSGASQEFTRHQSRLLASVERFMGSKLRSSVLERLEEYQRQRDRPTDADIRMPQVIDPLDAERARQAENMLETLQRIGELLADDRGRRKSVVLISEGIDYDIQNAVAQTRSGLSTFGSNHAQSVISRLRQAIGAMTRANIVVYGVDPRGIATGVGQGIEVGSYPENPHLGLGPTAFQDELRRAQDSLRVLSEETGGRASVSSNDFSDAFERIMRDNSTYYLLGYYSSHAQRDGRFRTIDVRVNRPGAHVRARKGYLAPSGPAAAGKTAAVTARMEPSAVLREILNRPLPLSGLPLRVFAAPFKGSGANGSVLVGLEVDARNFRFEHEDGLYTNKLEAAVVGLDHQGEFLKGDRHAVELRLRPETHEAVRANGLRLLFRLPLPPGRYQIRAAAHEAGSGAVGSVYYDLEVPDFRKRQLSVSGLVVTSASAASTPTPRPDPELAMLLPHPPAGSREFTPAETLVAGFALYGDPRQPTGGADVVALVEGTDGNVWFKSEIHILDQDLRAASDGRGFIVEVPLADMPPGTYVLRVSAKSRVEKALLAARQVPFRIRSVEGRRR